MPKVFSILISCKSPAGSFFSEGEDLLQAVRKTTFSQHDSMPAIVLTFANVADDAAWNVRTERLPLVSIDNAVDAPFLVF